MAQTGTGAGTGQIGYRVLGIYLNDHLAGATAGTELANRVARTHRAQGQGGQLKRLAVEVAQDRAALIAMMKALGIPIRAYKVCAAWIGEKAGRVKFNGRLLARSPLSDLEELELLRLGVEGKAAGHQLLTTGGTDGVQATRAITRDRAPADRPCVLVVTAFDLGHCVYQALKAGVSGFLLKDEPSETLAAAVRSLAAGDALLAPALLWRLPDEYVSRREPGHASPPPELTEREVEVLQLIGRGRSNSEIAAELFFPRPP